MLTGLAWMPDGGFQSVEGVWRENCLQWAAKQLSGSILAPLATQAPDSARVAVAIAERELRRLSGVEHGWRNHQFSLTRGSRSGPALNSLDEAPEALQAVCDAICDIYGWRRIDCPGTTAACPAPGGPRTDPRGDGQKPPTATKSSRSP